MNPDLIREYQSLKRQQSTLINQARQNEEKLRRIQQEELRFISANSLLELIQQILVNYRTNSGLDVVTLALIDPEFELQRTLKNAGTDPQSMPELIFFQTDEQLNQLYGLSLFPRLGKFNSEIHSTMFPGTYPALSSIACLPLTRQGRLTGSLNLGSNNPDRFLSNASTDFLERLSAIIAICLENTVNHERLKHVGLTDSLTGVNNRRFFDQRLVEEISRSKRGASPLTCLLLDIDYFKKINDTWGHQTGDRVLVEVANIIKSQLRETDVLARYGGEEFSVLLINSNHDDAYVIAERIRERIEQTVFHHNDKHTINLTISIGMSELVLNKGKPKDNSALGLALVNLADKALYEAKENGRNQTRVYGRHLQAGVTPDLLSQDRHASQPSGTPS